MSTIKRQKRNKKEQDSNLPVSLKDESQKLEDRENPENITAIEEYKAQSVIKPIFIPKETLFVEEGRFEKVRIALEIIVTIVGLGTLWWFIQSSATQHADSVNALKLAKESSDSSDIATKKSIALAESSFVATKKSLQLAQRNFQIENRPYVGIKNITIDSLEVGKKYVIKIFYQNFGKIPAQNLIITGIGEPHTIREYNIFKYDTTIGSIAVVPPSEILFATLVSDGKLTNEEIDNFRRGNWYLYVYGMITYSDVFNGKDTTTFCFMLDYSSKMFYAGRYNNRIK
ncbi:MAG: hypothetical protein ABSD46_08790 [Bacteroidota bacterium]